MAEKTGISWTDKTFNIVWGCSKVSAGCARCYAETLASRYGADVWGPSKPRRIFGDKHWQEPIKWDRQAAKFGTPFKVFCGSMCDWAEHHADLEGPRVQMWETIRLTPNLIWQLLTKRSHRVADLLPDFWEEIKPRVWLGVSIENNTHADRADGIRHIGSAVRFVSYEPALGPLDQLDLTGINWVIVGGESGPGFRPMQMQWARDMRTRCDAAGVAFFWKQGNGIRTEMQATLDGEIVRQWPRMALPMANP